MIIVIFTIFTEITVYLVYYNWSLIKNNISCIKLNTHKETKNLVNKIYKMGTVKQIDVKNRTYYFYNDMIDIKTFDSDLLKIDKKSYKDIGIYNIVFITIKKIDDYENIYSVNPLRKKV